jgi:hypothetical protein
MGGISGFVIMLVAGWTAMYFGFFPEEPKATQYATYLFFSVAITVAILGLRAAKAAILTLPVFMICAAVVITWNEWSGMVDQPDLNGDGIFTIRDILIGIFSILTATGKSYWEYIAGPLTPESGVVMFLELPFWLVSGVIRITLTCLFWMFALSWIPMVINYEPTREAEDG